MQPVRFRVGTAAKEGQSKYRDLKGGERKKLPGYMRAMIKIYLKHQTPGEIWMSRITLGKCSNLTCAYFLNEKCSKLWLVV